MFLAKYLNKLVVINPDSNLQSKYAILSNSQYNFKKFNFITGSFSQYIDSIFKEEGQGMVEYALIIVLVALFVIFALTAISGALGGVFDRVGDSLNI